MEEKEKNFDDKPFVPKGAMAFFVALILLFTVMWFAVYFVSISRIQ
jgi:hypothetical protein